MKSNTPLVQAKNVHVILGNNPVFTGLSFSIFAGQHLALIGPNGAGKSTILQLISGDLRLSQVVVALSDNALVQDNGCIWWGFSGTLDASPLEAREYVRLVSPAQQSNYVRQEWRITGREIILSGFSNTPMIYSSPSPKEDEEALQLAEDANLADLLTMEAPAMSQGQLRAALLMRAMVAKPALLLLDEPFDGLDAEARSSMAKLMEIAASLGSTLVVTAHRPEDIPIFIHRICKPGKYGLTALNAGIAPNQRTVEDCFSFAPGYEPVPTENSVLTPDDETTFLELIAKHFKKRTLNLPVNAAVLSLQNVDVFINRNHVLHGINWTVQKGEHWAVTGKNGSGKSTLLRLIFGEEFVAWGGTLSWFGRDNVPMPELHTLVGYVSDRLHYSHAYDLTAEDVVLSGHFGSIGLYDAPTAEDRFVAHSWMERLGIVELATTQYNALSTGQARRVLLARALAGAPPVLLLDEPFSGLDPQSRQQFLEFLPLLAKNGVHMIFVSHHFNDYKGVFTHELALECGNVVYSGILRKKG